MRDDPARASDARERYLILIDLTGYTAFLAGVERTHGADFSAGLPAGYRVLGELLQDLIDGVAPEFDPVKVEGDAVFGTASADTLDGRGGAVAGLALGQQGLAHHEQYPDVGPVDARIIDLADVAGVPVTTLVGPLPGSEDGPGINVSNP